MGYMRDKIGDAAMLEQLAEECAELGKAALKMARVLRKENPTPVTEDEASAMVFEEAADVLNCMYEVGVLDRPEALSFLAYAKQKRFKARWEEAYRTNFCPMCGADMREGEENEID